jgi:hypothetical protein
LSADVWYLDPAMTDAKSKVKIVAVITTIFGARALEVKRIAMSIVKCGGFGSPDEDVKSQKGAVRRQERSILKCPFRVRYERLVPNHVRLAVSFTELAITPFKQIKFDQGNGCSFYIVSHVDSPPVYILIRKATATRHQEENTACHRNCFVQSMVA